MRDFEAMRHSMFARAIRKNIVREPEWRARLNNKFLCWALSQRIVKTPQDQIPFKRQYERPEQNPITQRYWENTRGLLQSPAGIVPWIVELARHSVPDANVGVCKSFEQFVYHPDVQSPIIFSESGNWGNPFQFLNEDYTITWYFRLERCDQGEPAWINASSPTPLALLPGEPHFDINQMSDLWFPAASPSSQNIHITIGSRYRLRVFAIVEWTAEYSIYIAAKVRGFNMSVYNPHTLSAIRANW